MSGKSRVDLSSKLERMPAFEERAGVRIEALAAYLDSWPGENEAEALVMGELHASQGERLGADTALVVTCYDASGRVMATEEHDFFQDEFFGFEVFSVSFHDLSPAAAQGLGKIRIVPKLRR